MIKRLSLLAVAGTLALTGAVRAADTRSADAYLAAIGTPSVLPGRPAAAMLTPLDARVVTLGAGTAAIHYSYAPKRAGAVRVVTTLRTDLDGAAAPVRLVSYLSPGQRAEVSVAGAAGTEPASIELAYDGRHLLVRPIVAAQPDG